MAGIAPIKLGVELKGSTLRLSALDRAIGCRKPGDSNDDIVKRAETFEKYLKGGTSGEEG